MERGKLQRDHNIPRVTRADGVHGESDNESEKVVGVVDFEL